MNVADTQVLVDKIRAADAEKDHDQLETLMKELVLGAVVNLARMADAATRKKEKRDRA